MREIPIGVTGNDWDIEERMSQKTNTHRYESAVGLTGGIAFLAATEGGEAIHVDLSVLLAARPQELDSYFGTIAGSGLVTRLPVGAYPDRTVIWECVRFSPHYERYEPLLVRRYGPVP
jgi:hypothetical protein